MRKTPFCRLFEFSEKTGAKIIGAEAPSDCLPRGGAKAVLTPQGCKAASPSRARRQGILAAPAAAASLRIPRHSDSCSTWIRTDTMEVPTTSTPNGHHLPPIPNAGPRSPAPNRRTSPPFPRQRSASGRQRFTQAFTGQQTERPAHPPPPSHGRRRAHRRGDRTPWTHGQVKPAADQRPAQGVGGLPLETPPPHERGAMTPVPDTGTGHPINQAHAPQASPPATRRNRQGAEDAPQQREHDASGQGGDAEMTEASGPQESGNPLPPAAACSMPQQSSP